MRTKDLIEISIDQKAIAEYYYGCSIIEKKPIYKNIARADSKGTCAFFRKGNKFYLNDFSSNTIHDVYSLVQAYYGCDFKTALDNIIRDFGISTYTNRESYNKLEVYKNTHVTLINKETTESYYRYKTRVFNGYDAYYWSRFYITKKTLLKYDIVPVEYSELYRRQQIRYARNYTYQNDYESICFRIKLDDKVRFYQPNTPHRHEKWFGNANSKVVFGWTQLDHSNTDVIIIASGIKDLLCLSELGFSVIAPASEPTELPEDVVNDLKNSNKRIIYLYDTDLAGLKCATKYAIKHGFEAVWLPKSEGLKDVADYMELLGKESMKELINLLIYKN